METKAGDWSVLLYLQRFASHPMPIDQQYRQPIPRLDFSFRDHVYQFHKILETNPRVMQSVDDDVRAKSASDVDNHVEVMARRVLLHPSIKSVHTASAPAIPFMCQFLQPL
jgi:hypothetical protein